MKTFLIMVGIALTLFEGCNDTQKTKKKNIPSPVPADSIILKYKSTKIRKDKLIKGIYNYIDTTFKSGVFLIKDTINEINVTGQGRGYIILGRPKNHEDLQCFFINEKELDSLRPKQIITISSDRMTGRAVSKVIESDTINIFVVQMGKCKLIKN